MYRREEKCAQNIGRRNGREETTLVTLAIKKRGLRAEGCEEE
jgi:hypothetical protein